MARARRSLAFAAAAVSLLALADRVDADEPRFDVGVRFDLSLADGEPANDIPAYGVAARWRPNERWAWGAALDVAEFDFEEPAKRLGLAQDPAVEPLDAKAESTELSLWFERTLGAPSARGHWYAGAGLGFVSLDVPSVSGPLAGGGQFEIETDGGNELVLSVLGGRRIEWGERWALDLALHLDQHFADWTVVDRVSGRTASIDDYFTYGGTATLAIRF